MNTDMTNWFTEISEEMLPGQRFSLKVKKILYEGRSNFQDILIFESETYGRVLVLDGVTQCTERDEYAYQEMISFLPLCAHPNPEKVLIVGGGDGGVAREVVKHPSVKSVDQVEIDGRVVELSKQFLPHMACGFDSSKVKLTIGDGFEFMKNNVGKYDVIITDSSDPIGPAEALFEMTYFDLMRKALKPGGIICSQGGSYTVETEWVRRVLNNCRRSFPNVAYAGCTVPSYPSGAIGFIIACTDADCKLDEPKLRLTNDQGDSLNLRYYTTAVHSAAFVLPRTIEKILYED